MDSNVFNHFVVSNSSLQMESDVSDMVTSSNSFNDVNITTFSLRGLTALHSIVIGDDCYQYAREVIFDGLPSLQSLSIGMNSFTNKKFSYAYDPSRSLTISNCNSLVSITIGYFSFSDFSSLSLLSTQLIMLFIRSPSLTIHFLWKCGQQLV